MNFSRRDLGLLSLAATTVGSTASAAATPLPSKTYRFEDLTVKDNGKTRSRAILNGETHSGFPIEMHMTELAPGEAPHPPHHHVHEEMIMIHEGTLEVTISGNAVKLGPGSSTYVASNEEHGWKNVGTTHALYFVLALGRDQA
jgi:quercetin dioxygenase-like cupin family protein